MTKTISTEECRNNVHHQEGRPSTIQRPTEYETLVHDLQVHQIELELQNEELQRAQEQLNDALERYADLYDFAPVGFLTTDRDCRILESNLTFASQVKIERSRLINTPLWQYAVADNRNMLQAHIKQVFTTNNRQSCELRLATPGGADFFVQLDSIPVPHGDGVQLCRTSVTDISKIKDAEGELVKIHAQLERRVEERTAELFVNERKYRILSKEFQTLLNAITDTLILFSPDMKVLWTNSDFTVTSPDTTLDTLKQYFYTLINACTSPSSNSPVGRCFASGEKEVTIINYYGAVLDLRAFPVIEGLMVNSVLLLVSDITEKMALQAEAMHAAHMASLGELASGVAHEINNPITGIINYGQILINECAPTSIERDIGERVVKEGDRIGRIVRTLLSYARDGREEKIPTSILAVFEESVILTQAQIRKEGINLQVNLPSDLPPIRANFQQIQQCFINIINNARYALNDRFPERHADKRLAITGDTITVSDCPFVRIVFYDQGVGIAAHEMPMITKQFYSTKPFGKGTGLGLHITQKIIKDHGGQISFESDHGQFTRVTLLFPADCQTDGGGQ